MDQNRNITSATKYYLAFSPKLKEDYHGVIYLTEALDLVLKEGKPCDGNEHRVRLEVRYFKECLTGSFFLFLFSNRNMPVINKTLRSIYPFTPLSWELFIVVCFVKALVVNNPKVKY